MSEFEDGSYRHAESAANGHTITFSDDTWRDIREALVEGEFFPEAEAIDKVLRGVIAGCAAQRTVDEVEREE